MGDDNVSKDNLLIVCPNDVRRGEIMTMVEARGRDTFKATSYANTRDMPDMVRPDREGVRVTVLSLIGGVDVMWSMGSLRNRFPNAGIIVELDVDDPDRAFDLIRWEAFAVVTRSEDLWDMILKAASGQQHPYERFLKVSRPQRKWGFMSMSFDSAKRDNDDYRLAVKPTMRRLQLELNRFDEIVREPGIPRLEQMIRRIIAERPALVAQISSSTPNTAMELGLAYEQNKTIIPIRRRGSSEPVPAMIRDLVYIEYSSATELALRLFFGLGGTRADLHRCPKWWMTDSGNGELIK